ncbi:MFS transporter [Patescibacteria group bacterium]|nr:MFS transporter [Patescibacteria group bacterium]MDE1946386.1 MFS transporter [Patescibacteria group bacterium]MDE2010838.1 MFS transporter [Patescibacteria group bacterium]MDE2233102.1 MFS transporter [Patescibacteria group bacterium]
MNPRSRRALPVILFTVLLDLVSTSILIPILPVLFANPDSPAYLLSAGTPVAYGYIILGLLIGAWPVAQFFAAPVLGELSDIYGRKKILALSVAGTCLSLLLFSYGALVKSLTVLFVSRIVGGITGGNIVVAQAVIADVTPVRERGKNFGLIGAAYGIGFILGPIIGGLLSDGRLYSWFSVLTPFLFAAGLEVVNLVAIFVFLPETGEEGERSRPSWFIAFRHLVAAYDMKGLRSVFASNFFLQAGFSFFATFFSVYLIHRFGFGQKGIGLYFAYGGICLALAQAVVVRLLAKRFESAAILRWSLLLGSFTILGYYFPHSLAGLLFIMPLLAVANGLSMALLPALVSERASPRMQGEVLGINMSLQSLAQAIPPILSGFLAAELAPETPVYVAGIVVFAAWVIFVLGVKK